MCDTLAVKRRGAVWFAKNSDREPEEPQLVEYHPPAANDAAPTVRCTYIEVDQAPDRHGVMISRPSWMWGAEMGVNDAGVAVGNEAVFSRSVLRKGQALLGMDLVRLALERADSAEAAADIIVSLLERYGQGGPAGYRDKRFRYDNSFLIADARTILVLETAGRKWAVKNAGDAWSLSNAYTLGTDYDRSCEEAGTDFRIRNEAFAMPRLARAAERRRTTLNCVRNAPEDMSLSFLASVLRTHAKGDGFDGGSNRDLCMHARGALRPHAATASMAVRLAPGAAPAAVFTGTIHPCISLFKPMGFRGDFAAADPGLSEKGRRAAKRASGDPEWRRGLRESIAETENEILPAIEAGEAEWADRLACEWIRRWLH